jgi:hypothetical protein
MRAPRQQRPSVTRMFDTRFRPLHVPIFVFRVVVDSVLVMPLLLSSVRLCLFLSVHHVSTWLRTYTCTLFWKVSMQAAMADGNKLRHGEVDNISNKSDASTQLTQKFSPTNFFRSALLKLTSSMTVEIVSIRLSYHPRFECGFLRKPGYIGILIL